MGGGTLDSHDFGQLTKPLSSSWYNTARRVLKAIAFTFDTCQVRRKKKVLTFHCTYTGCLTGILIMVYYNLHLTVQKYNPVYPQQLGALFHCPRNAQVYGLRLMLTVAIFHVQYTPPNQPIFLLMEHVEYVWFNIV